MQVARSFKGGGLLSALGVTSPASPNLLDIDSDGYFEFAGLEEFAKALLAQEGNFSGPRGGAWATYREDGVLTERLARVIARRAGRNYLVAAMTSVLLSE